MSVTFKCVLEESCAKNDNALQTIPGLAYSCTKPFFSDNIPGLFIIYVPASNQICDNLLLTGKRARKGEVRRHRGGDSR